MPQVSADGKREVFERIRAWNTWPILAAVDLLWGTEYHPQLAVFLEEKEIPWDLADMRLCREFLDHFSPRPPIEILEAIDKIIDAVEREILSDPRTETEKNFRLLYQVNPKEFVQWAELNHSLPEEVLLWASPDKISQHGPKSTVKEHAQIQREPAKQLHRAQLYDNEKAILLASFAADCPLPRAKLAARASLEESSARIALKGLIELNLMMQIGERGGFCLTEPGKERAEELRVLTDNQ